MSKKEALLPESTVGGRIQKLRHQKKLSRSEFYDRIFPYGEAGSDASKEKTVRSWESGKYELNYESMTKVCRILNCSSDYLLGLDECTNKTNQFIHDQTGLSEDAIKTLRLFAHDKYWMPSLNFLFSSEYFIDMLSNFYWLGHSKYFSSYAIFMSNKEGTDAFKDIMMESFQSEDLFKIDIRTYLENLMESVCNEAETTARHDFNSPSGSKAFEEIIKNYTPKSEH